MAELTKQEKTVVDSFMNLQRTLFSDGEIPSLEEVRARIDSGSHTVADSFIAKMYNDGVPDEPILAELDETKDFYSKFEKTFSREVVGPARNTTGISNNIAKLQKNGVDLGSSFAEFEAASKTPLGNISEDVRKNIVRPFKVAADNVLELKLSRTGASKGTRKLAKGAIPAEVLQSVLQGIGDIPDPVTRDAVMAALLGYRGEDLSGMRTSRALAIRSKPVRPFYDREAGVARDPEVATGGGRKAKGPDKPPGPVLREILNRRYDAAGATGELFPGMTTGKISAALEKHVFTKIPQNVLDKLLVKPSGYTALRRITASAIANQLGRPDLASEIISHKGSGESLLDKVMTGYYTDVEDISGLQQRGEILVAYEKMMADAVGATDAKGLGEALRLDLAPEFNAQYPEVDAMATPSQAPVQPTTATPEEIAQGEQLRAAKTAEATEQSRLTAQETGYRADDLTIKRGENATAVAEANLKIKEATAEVAAGKAAQQEADRVKNHQSTLEFIKNTYKKLPGPVKKGIAAIPYVGSAIASEMTRSAFTQQAEALGLPSSVAGPLGVAAGATEFLPVSPSDVIEVGRSMASPVADPGSARPIERVMADQPELFNQAPAAAPAAQPQITEPVRVPDAVQNVPTSFLSNPERLRQARGAAREGKEATGFISYTP
jgi:hypothetical protein